MNELLGKRFHIEQSDYTIVDVRKIGGEVMVYAEPPGLAKGPGRAAFRYADIESHLESNAEQRAIAEGKPV